MIPYLLIHPSLTGDESISAVIYSDKIDYKLERIKKKAESGIFIPVFLREKFDDKKRIYPGDPKFVSAFVEAFFQFDLRQQGFKLEKKEESPIRQ